MSIIKVSKNTGYINDFTNAGLIFSDNGVIIIDNGWGIKQGKRILEILQNNKLKVIAIINTHAHLDHSGANDYIQKQTGCSIYSSKFQVIMMSEPMLMPYFYSFGATPLKEGLTRAFLNDPIKAKIINQGIFLIDGVTLEIVELSGHSDGHIGIICDNVLFCGDAVFSTNIIDENKILFFNDVCLQRKTLKYIMDSKFDAYISAHGKHFKDPRPACEKYLQVIDNIENLVLEAAKSPLTTEQIVSFVCNCLELKIESYGAYCVSKVPILSVIHTLSNDDVLEYFFKDNTLIFQIKEKSDE